MDKTKKKRMLLISVLVFSCVASIVISSIVGIQKGDISIFLSLLCSFFSIILSVVALWYTSKSGLAMDEQFDTLKKNDPRFACTSARSRHNTKRLNSNAGKFNSRIAEKNRGF